MVTKRGAGALATVLFVSSAYGAHPLNTEDTGTQGRGGWQLELNGERNRDEGVNGAQAAAVLSYGFTETADLQAGLAWQDTGVEKGAGDSLVAVKWRFWEQHAWSAGLRGGVSLPSGDDERGLGAGRTTWAALLIGQYDGERWMFLSHLGYRRNRNTLGERESIAELSGAVLYKASGALRLLLDAVATRNPDPQSERGLRSLVAGFIWSASKDIDLDAGIRRGNDPAIDRAVMAGVTLRW